MRRRAQRRDRHVGLAVGEIDHREAGCDLRPRRAFEALVDLVLQELGGLVEQIDRNEALGEPADHLVAAPADRRQLAELEEHAERVDRRQIVALRASGRSARTARTHCPAPTATASELGCEPRRGPRRRERVANSGRSRRRSATASASVLTSVESPRQIADSVSSSFCASGGADLVALLLERDLELLGLGRRPAIGRVDREPVVVERVALVAERLGQPAAQHRNRGSISAGTPITSSSARRLAAPA